MKRIELISIHEFCSYSCGFVRISNEVAKFNPKEFVSFVKFVVKLN